MVKIELEITNGMRIRMLRINELKKKLGHKEVTDQELIEHAIAAYWLAIEKRAMK